MPILCNKSLLKGIEQIVTELILKTKRAIAKLIQDECANYYTNACLLCDYECWQKLMHYNTNNHCKYFLENVLPLNPSLESVLLDADEALKTCICGNRFRPKGKKKTCSQECASELRRNTVKACVKRHRENRG